MIRTVAAILLFAVATPALAADPVKAPADPNKVRCKRETTTGSLVQSTKICHTEAEWHQMALDARDQAIRLQSPMNGKSGG